MSKMTFPFDDVAWLKEGQVCLLSGDKVMNELERIKFGEEGVTGSQSVARWEVTGGVIRLFDKRDREVILLDGARIFGGQVVAVGRMAEGVAVYACPFVSMSEKTIKVAISSHVDYYDITVPRLIRSLKRDWFSNEDILVVVGGAAERREELVDGVRTLFVCEDKMGWTANLVVRSEEKPDYWLFLHDTCELTEEFTARIAEINVGFPFDIVRFSDDKRHDLGFFSSRFLDSHPVGLSEKARPDHIGGDMFMEAESILVLNGQKTLREKDVYGMGVSRHVDLYERVGIKKYSGQLRRGGRP